MTIYFDHTSLAASDLRANTASHLLLYTHQTSAIARELSILLSNAAEAKADFRNSAKAVLQEPFVLRLIHAAKQTLRTVYR